MRGLKRLIALALLCAGLLVGHSLAPAAQEKKDPQDKKTDQEPKKNTAVIPKAGIRQGRHKNFVEIAKKGDIDILLMGDSITDWWRNAGKTHFQKYWEPLKTANFGVAGDTTQGVLWGMDNGELDGYTPKLMMLMIGTNNIGRNTPPEIAEGIKAVVDKFRAKHPEAKVLLLGVFPRAGASSTARTAVNEINKIISKYDDGKFIHYMDIGPKFLDKDGNIPKDIMGDGLHPTAKGYEIWAEAVMPKVYELIGKAK
jgi:lysophospholipase L1-like esterase